MEIESGEHIGNTDVAQNEELQKEAEKERSAEYISAVDAASIYRVTPGYVTRMCRSHQLRGILVDSTWLVSRDSLESFFGEGQIRRSLKKRKHPHIFRIRNLNVSHLEEDDRPRSLPMFKKISSPFGLEGGLLAFFGLVLLGSMGYLYTISVGHELAQALDAMQQTAATGAIFIGH
jgi:hypothetical protein